MSTIKQIAANQQNAKRSTGPRTEEGRRRASQNAIKHGLYTHEFCLDIESEDDYHMHRDQLLHDYAPQTAAEFMLIESYLTAFLLKRRYMRKMQDLHITESRKMNNETLITYPILMKMINQADRMFYRAMDNLERIKKERIQEQKSVPKKKTNNLPEIGFVSSPFATRDPNEPYPTRREPDIGEQAA